MEALLCIENNGMKAECRMPLVFNTHQMLHHLFLLDHDDLNFLKYVFNF